MRKIIFWIIGILAVILLALFIGVPIVANNQLDKAIAKANEQGNSLRIGERNISYRLTHLDVDFDSIFIDQDRSGQRFTGDVERIEVNGISLLPLLSKKYRVGELLVRGPRIKQQPGQSTVDSSGSGNSPNLVIDSILVAGGSFEKMSQEGALVMRMLGIGATGSLALPLDSTSAPRAALRVDSIMMPAGSKANWYMNDLVVDAGAGEIRLGKARLTPNQTASAFLKDLTYKEPWMAIRVDNLRCIDFPFAGAAAGEKIVLPDVTIGDFALNVYENPRVPQSPNEGRKPFPVQSMRKLERSVLLQKVTVDRANIDYGVLQEDNEIPAIKLNGGKITARNFSSYEQADSAVVEADFTFEVSSPLSARFAFDQAGNGRSFLATGQLGAYDLTKVNPLMIAAAGAFVEAGDLQQLHYTFSANGDKSRGDLLMRYSGLDVDMEGIFLKDWAAGVAVRQDNPRPDGDLMVGTVRHTHDATKSFFNFYWKSILSGLKSSAMGNFFQSDEQEAEEVN